MRVFSTEAAWDKKEGKWIEIYYIDSKMVESDEYFLELEAEECIEESMDDEVPCDCLICKEKRAREMEVENGNMMDDDYQECDDCVEQRRLDALDEQEEMCNQCDACDGCNNGDDELTDWQKQIVDIVEDFAFKIEHEIETDGLCECGCTLRNMLADMFYQARQIGFGDGMECGIESVEEKTVNYHIDNLTVNSNEKDFIEQLQNLSRIRSCNL